MKYKNKEKLYNAILGLAIADALGVPAEFKPRVELKENPITDMVSGGIWNQPAGTWSDDTAMTLATIDALNKNNWENTGSLLDDIMKNFMLWYYDSVFAANENRFDIGNTCRQAILNYEKNKNTNTCGLRGSNCGNGALMRILPTAFIETETNLNNLVVKISSLTHNNDICNTASIIYISFVKLLLKHQDKDLAYAKLIEKLGNKVYLEEFERILTNRFKDCEEGYIKSTGYVVDTLEAAIWCFLNTDSYKECVLKAVNLGGDTDTVAAVAGGLSGIYYGINEKDGIPREWIKKLSDIETLESIVFNRK